ncbi:porin [Microvirga terricola]|uniref:Porin n=1 Tax=Microvirga terricola TaxID=2719797 RepID=A0ABX0VBF7_9HYPH|nr:porin [Microvirga terricola]NIX77174.1 hypothetical protein [Microvirga terricola]
MRRLLALGLSSLALGSQAEAAPLERAPQAAPQFSPCPPGFSVLQDRTTCVRISGRVQADAVMGSAPTRGFSSVGMQARGRVQLDVRKQTEYGPLRAVIRAEGQTR